MTILISIPCFAALFVLCRVTPFEIHLLLTMGACLGPFVLYLAFRAYTIYHKAPGESQILWLETHQDNREPADPLEVLNWLHLNERKITARCVKRLWSK